MASSQDERADPAPLERLLLDDGIEGLETALLVRLLRDSKG